VTATAADRVARLRTAAMEASDNSRPALAARRLRSALRVLDDAPDPAVRGRVLVSLAWAESERGRVEIGQRLLDEALPLLPVDNRALVHAQRAVLLHRHGRNDEAMREFDVAVRGLTERDHPLDLAKALNNRSLLHLEEGDVGAARDDLRRCLRIAVRHGIEVGAALIRMNLGCLDVVSGDLPSALRAFATARGEYLRVAPGRMPGLAIERARALIAAGLFREADRDLAEAMRQARDQHGSHHYAIALQVRAEAALLGGRPAAAMAWAREARALFLARRNSRLAALNHLMALRAESASVPGGDLPARARRLAARLRAMALPEDARVAALVAARALVARAPSAAERLIEGYGPPGRLDRLDTRLLWRLARAEHAYAIGHRREASRHLIAGMAALHRHRAQLGCLDLQTGASAHGQDLTHAGLAAALRDGSVADIYRWSERARAQALLLPPVRPPDDPAAAAALEDLRQTRYALREAELAGNPAAELRSRAESLQRAVREQSWSAHGPDRAAAAAPAPLAEVRAALGDAALVAYLRDGDALSALVIGSTAEVVPLGAFRTAEEAVLRLRADLDTRAGRSMPRRLAEAVQAATRSDAAALAAAVLDPLWPLVGDRELVVAPTGLLMTTPWAVLPGNAGRPVTVVPSATAWLAARARRTTGRTGGGALVAGPGIDRGADEIAAIAGLRAGATTLTGAAATPAATLRAMDGAPVAHLAAHGLHQAENPLFSSLELASGPVLGYDLQRLEHPPALVVLSSCELGLSDVRPGDESFGLGSALLVVGTATVVASVSRVADDAAMEAMIGFHRAVASGRSPATALASAVAERDDVGFVCLGAG
jgi:tetratricopeptide (TPR) repeat protein